MNEPEVFTESVVAPPPDAHANGSNSPAAPAADAVSTTPLVPEMMAPTLPEPEVAALAQAIQPVPTVPAPAPPVAVLVPSTPAAPGGDSLEDRLRRLEATLTALAEVKPVAPAAPVAQVVADAPSAGPKTTLRGTASKVLSASRWLLPPGLGGARDTTEEPPSFASESKSPWFLFDALNELITYKYMYGDPRYRLTWTGRVIPIVLVVLILVPWDSLPPISLVAKISAFLAASLAKLLELFFAFLLFKVLNREARRYRTLVPQYPPIVPH